MKNCVQLLLLIMITMCSAISAHSQDDVLSTDPIHSEIKCGFDYTLIAVQEDNTWFVQLGPIKESGTADNGNFNISINDGKFTHYPGGGPIAYGVEGGETIHVVIQDEDDPTCLSPMSITLAKFDNTENNTEPSSTPSPKVKEGTHGEQ